MTSPTPAPRRIRVALFLIVTVTVLVAAVTVLGHSQNLFSHKAVLHATFANAGGLITGSEVRLAGVAVGSVRKIRFSRENQRVGVDLSVRSDYLEWIRKDSVAQVASKGLLGDSVIDISVGSPDEEALKTGDAIESSEPAGFGQIVADAAKALKLIDGLVVDIDDRLRLTLTPGLATDVGVLVHSLAGAAAGIQNGRGLAHTLIYEPGLAATTAQAVAEFQGSGGELKQLLTQVRTGKGPLHDLIYEQDGENLVRDLSEASRIVRKIAVETDEGKGTIGGLIKDPTVYEDLTTILGNVKRNSLLKALIRFTIVKDGIDRPGRVEERAEPAARGPEDAARLLPAP